MVGRFRFSRINAHASGEVTEAVSLDRLTLMENLGSWRETPDTAQSALPNSVGHSLSLAQGTTGMRSGNAFA